MLKEGFYMSIVGMVKNLIDAYRIERDGRFIAVSDSFMQEVHPSSASQIYRMVDDTIEEEEIEVCDIDLKEKVG